MQQIGYLRVSTGRQMDSGAGIEAQRSAILAEAERRGWNLADLRFIEEAATGSNSKRPGLEAARKVLANGDAGSLVVAKMDRLSRSLLDFASIMQESQRHGWALIALDCPVDLGTPMGNAMASIIATFAQWEREVIGERTRDGLAEKRAAGVKLGRPRTMSPDVRDRIKREREDGRTLQAIADALNAEAVPTAHGGKAWYPSSVRAAAA